MRKINDLEERVKKLELLVRKLQCGDPKYKKGDVVKFPINDVLVKHKVVDCKWSDGVWNGWCYGWGWVYTIIHDLDILYDVYEGLLNIHNN